MDRYGTHPLNLHGVVHAGSGFGPRLTRDLLKLAAEAATAVRAEALAALQALATSHSCLLLDHWDSLRGAMLRSLEVDVHASPGHGTGAHQKRISL